jgi:hypothetical protein
MDVPASPKPLTVFGTDAMSAAINEVLPTIETPVIDGLPVAEAALEKTASNMATAADLYDETDSASAGDIAGTQFNSDDTTARRRTTSTKRPAVNDTGADSKKPVASAFEQLSGQLSEQLDSLAEKLPSAEEAAQQLGQMAPMMGSMSQSLSGQVQGLMSKAHAGGQNPSAPPAPDTTVDDAKTEEEKKAEEEQKAAEAAAAGATQEAAPQADGAASGSTDGLRVPIADADPSAETLLPGATQGAVE